MPKVMKDMAYNVISKAPNMKHELVTTSFYIGEDQLKLFVLDCSSKYVTTRYDGFNAVSFPTEQAQITRCMSAIFKSGYGRQIDHEKYAAKIEQ
ncbi:hypothetical protein PS15m_011117 [Mucor circinelloides]